MAQALQIDAAEALERSRDLLAGGYSEEFEEWIRYEMPAQPPDHLKAERAQQARDFIASQKKNGEGPSFDR